MAKRIITVGRRVDAFKCGSCNRTVDVRIAKPKIVETEDTIVHGWDYGHEHKRVFHVINKKAFIIEGF